MRVIYIPTDPMVWIIAAVVIGVVLVVVYFKQRRDVTPKLLADARYQQALSVYAGNLPSEDPTRDERRDAFGVAVLYLLNEHGVPSEEASPNLRRVVQVYDRDRSYEWRHEAIAHEEAGQYEQALAYFERAARLQEDHDPKDHQFLLRCIARVRGKLGRG